MTRVAPKVYQAAREINDLETLASGDPERIARRARNKALGRLLGRAGIWRLLWK
jgi:hypothetical protein